jgi:hypothetical protein
MGLKLPPLIPAVMSQTSNPVRVLGLSKKREGMSNEEFRTYWEKTHGPKVLALLKKHGGLYYSQVRIGFHFHFAHNPPLLPTWRFDLSANLIYRRT